jgi:hypothetical protein
MTPVVECLPSKNKALGPTTLPHLLTHTHTHTQTYFYRMYFMEIFIQIQKGMHAKISQQH